MDLSRTVRDMNAGGMEQDEILRRLRRRGADQLESIKALRVGLGIGLGEAKKIVDSSDVWADERATTERLRDAAEEAASE